MRAAVILALLMATPATGSDYSVTIIGESLGEQQSVFREMEFPGSTFAEKMEPSSGSFSSAGSSFGLQDMNEETRVRTEAALSDRKAVALSSTCRAISFSTLTRPTSGPTRVRFFQSWPEF